MLHPTGLVAISHDTRNSVPIKTFGSCTPRAGSLEVGEAQ